MSSIKNKFLGTYGKIGCFSFAPNKIITTGQGGVVVTNDKSIEMITAIKRLLSELEIKATIKSSPHKKNQTLIEIHFANQQQLKLFTDNAATHDIYWGIDPDTQ